MKILERLKGDGVLDAIVTFKMAQDEKDQLVEYCALHNISLGKLVREGLTMIMKAIKEEERPRK